MGRNDWRILLIEPEPSLLAAARARGFETWSLRSPGADPDALRARIVETARVHGIRHVLYVGDRPALHHAVEEALVLVSPGRAASLHTLQDPATMRRTLNQAGVSVVNAVVVASMGAARVWLESLRHPAVVKTGPGRGIDIIRDPGAVEAWVAGRPSLPCVIEEFLEGPRLIVDTFTHAGAHHVLGMTAAGLADGPLVHPADLADLPAAAARATVRALLDLSGLDSGRVRTHVVLTSQGPRIASAQASPVPGPVARLREAVTGQDPGAEVLAVLAKGADPRFLAGRD
ncbi:MULTISPECIES: hypothetical protein [Streptomyces]|uniref:ATP-grasp domain-containing protein n=1 Tax=Streptomyces indiaensis TaxID=284033 RepID=A0ABN3DRS5_9ACTN|nr:hypothetical protein [Streptomyces indiaensis]MCF1644875.1 hypothetical protein [Streptomyces indiaensis]